MLCRKSGSYRLYVLLACSIKAAADQAKNAARKARDNTPKAKEFAMKAFAECWRGCGADERGSCDVLMGCLLKQARR